MVSIRDRALIEARAKGLDIEAALKHPFRQLLKPDIVISAFAVSVMLLIYYTAVGFSLIYLTTVFGFSVKDGNGLGNWNWGFNVIAVLLVGIISDRFRVRKPFMVIGGVIAAVMVVVYLEQAGHHPGYYTVALMLAALSLGLGIAFAPWMASFTETVEARNPALTATGLAIWGWILRVVVFVSFLIIPAVVNTVTPWSPTGPRCRPTWPSTAQLAFASILPGRGGRRAEGPAERDRDRDRDPGQRDRHRRQDPGVGYRHRHRRQRATGQRAEVRARAGPDPGQPSLFTELAADPTNTALLAQAVAAAGGGAKGLACWPRSPPTRPPSAASSRSARSCRRSRRTRPTCRPSPLTRPS